jgi:ribonuclease HI
MEDVKVHLCKCSNAQDMLMTIFAMDEEKRLRTIAFLWQWWTARNKRNANDGEKSLEEVAFQTRRWAKEFAEFYAHKGAKARQPVEERRWTPPTDPDVLKINVDGAFADNPNRGGWGFVIRDHRGQVVGAGAGRLEFPHSAAHSEAEACIQALVAASSWGMTRVLVESDCQTLVNALNKASYDRSPIGVVVRDTRMMARLNFVSSSFVFAKRDCNKVAHAIAALGVSGIYSEGQFWPDAVPSDVLGLVASEFAMPTS